MKDIGTPARPFVAVSISDGEVIGLQTDVPNLEVRLIDYDFTDGPDRIDGQPCAISSHEAELTAREAMFEAEREPTCKPVGYRTTIHVTVLSDRPLTGNEALEDIIEQGNSGDYVTTKTLAPSLPLDGPNMVEALEAAGSEASFFQLDENGEELE